LSSAFSYKTNEYTITSLRSGTDLFFGGPDNVIDPVDVVDDRPVGDDGGDITVLIDDACLWDVPVFDGWKV